MNAAACEADDNLSFHVVRYGDREDFAERWPVLAKVVGDDFFRRHGENPDIRNSTPCLFCLLDPAGKAVSSIHGYADTLTVRGTDYPWIWTGALQTVPELQGRGLATRLQGEGTEYTRRHGIGRGSVFSTDVTLHIYRKLGYCQPGFVPRYISLRSMRPVVRGHVKSPWGRGLAYGLSQPLLTGTNAVFRMLNKARSRVADFHEVGSPWDEQVQTVIERINARRGIHFNTSSEKLAWKIAHSVRRGGIVSTYVLRNRQAASVGYAIVRTRRETTPLAERYWDFDCMSLMDYGLVDETEDLFVSLLANLVERFHKSDAEVLQVICNAAAVRRRARRYGLLAIGKGMSFSFCVPTSWNLSGVNLQQMSTWPVNNFSGDGPSI